MVAVSPAPTSVMVKMIAMTTAMRTTAAVVSAAKPCHKSFHHLFSLVSLSSMERTVRVYWWGAQCPYTTIYVIVTSSYSLSIVIVIVSVSIFIDREYYIICGIYSNTNHISVV